MALTLSNEELQELQNLVDDIPTRHGLPIVMFFLRINEDRKKQQEVVNESNQAEIKELKKES